MNNLRLFTILNLFIFIPLCFLHAQKSNSFGYVACSGYNLGDDIQSIAAKQFLPSTSIPIDREFVGEFRYDKPVKTILNGWFMHTKTFMWYRDDMPGPEISWPPAPAIDPLIISIHFTENVLPTILTPEGIKYLQEHGPVGARDFLTLEELQKRNIPSYFSGCLTLTMTNDCTQREDIIYAVDIDNECVNFIKSKTKSKVKVLTHKIGVTMMYEHAARLTLAKSMLERYKHAKCVVTSRLHAAMPCLAFKTPVFLINIPSKLYKFNSLQHRFDGLQELTHNGSREDFLKEKIPFDFNNPPENPGGYLPIRERLIETITNWVKKIQIPQ